MTTLRDLIKEKWEESRLKRDITINKKNHSEADWYQRMMDIYEEQYRSNSEGLNSKGDL